MKLNGNLLVLTQWSFKDALVQTYTLPYVEIIRQHLPPNRKIILVTSEQERLALTQEELRQINLEWASRNMELHTQGYTRYGWRKLVAFAGQFISLLKLIRKENIKAIHAFCTPAGSIGYLLSVLSRVPLVIDSFEPHAEAMVENGNWKPRSLPYRMLFFLEKKQAARARYLICAAEGMREYASRKWGLDISAKMFVKAACVDRQQFSWREKDPVRQQELGLQDKIVCIYAGKLGGIYYDKEVFSFLQSCYAYWGNRFRMLMLTNTGRSVLDKSMQDAGVPTEILISLFVPHQQVPDYMALADFGITPVKSIPTKKYCTPIKDGEYWAMGLPVIISPNISDDSAIIEEEQAGAILDFTNKEAHQKALEKVESLLKEEAVHRRQRIMALAERYRSFSIPQKIYPAVYEN